MRTRAVCTVVVAFVASMLASTAGAVSPEAKCEAGKNQESGKYAFCLHKAEAKLLKTKGACSVTTATDCYRDEECPPLETCVKDPTNYNEAVTKCEDKYAAKWTTLEQKAAEVAATCPDEPLLQADVKQVIDECVSNVASGLAGDGLTDCTGDLATCSGDLSTCNGNLGTCNGSLSTCNSNYATCTGSLATCNSDLATAQNDLTTCNGSLGTCNGNYSSCSASLTTCNNNYAICSASLTTVNSGTADLGDVLSGKTFSSSAGLGVTGAMTNVGQQNVTPGTSAVTITQGYHNGTGSVAGDADLLAGNIVNGVNIFGVTGTAGIVAAQTLKTGQTTSYGTGSDGDLQKGASRSFTDNGDGTITDNTTGLMWEKKSDDGSIHDKDTTYTWGMTSSPYTMNGTMVTTFLAALNGGGGFAGYTDWRIPNRFELESLLNLQNVSPVTHSAFNTGCAASCTVTTCSCTQSLFYWSSTTYPTFQHLAWIVYFGHGAVDFDTKSLSYYVRAVRTGL